MESMSVLNDGTVVLSCGLLESILNLDGRGYFSTSVIGGYRGG
jgi:uncharacterized membrane protein YiaA